MQDNSNRSQTSKSSNDLDMPLMDTWGSGLRVFFLSCFTMTVLVSLIYPFGYSRRGGQARVKACISNMRTMEGAIEMYLMDHDSKDCKWLPRGENKSILMDTDDKSPLVKEKYLKRFPVCRGGGKYSLRGPVDALEVECSVHGTVNNSRPGNESGVKKILPDALKNLKRDMLFSFILASLMSLFTIGRLKQFSNESGKMGTLSFNTLIPIVFFEYSYVGIILSMMQTSQHPKEKAAYYFVFFLLFRGIAIALNKHALTTDVWSRDVLKRFLKTGLVFDALICIGTAVITVSGRRSGMGLILLFGSAFVLYAVVMSWLYVNLKKGVWKTKSDVSKQIIYRRPFTFFQKAWLFIVICIAYIICRNVISDQLRYGGYRLDRKVNDAAKCSDTMKAISNAASEFISYNFQKGMKQDEIYRMLGDKVDPASPLVVSKDLKNPVRLRSYSDCKYSIKPFKNAQINEKSAGIKVICSEHGTFAKLKKTRELLYGEKARFGYEKQRKGVLKVVFLSFFFSLLLALRMRPGQHEKDRPLISDFFTSDFNGHNIYRTAFITQTLLIMFIAFQDLFYLDIPRVVKTGFNTSETAVIILLAIRILWYVFMMKSLKMLKNKANLTMIFAIVVDLIYCGVVIAEPSHIVRDTLVLYTIIQLIMLTLYHSIMSSGAISRQKELLGSLTGELIK